VNATLRRGLFTATLEAVTLGTKNLAPVLLLWLSVRGVVRGELNPGTMLAVNSMVVAALSRLDTLLAACRRLRLLTANVERIKDVLAAAPERLDPHREDFPTGEPLRGGIELRNVSYSWSSHAKPILKRISLTIRPGEKIVLTGRTGSGKTTLGMLLLGLYQPGEGQIFFDGKPVASIDPRRLRASCGLAMQEPALFSGSIRENILAGAPEKDLNAAIEASRIAELHGEIAAMPLGYETVLSESGANLSGGQRQRLALARALARRPRVLLLDEATSQLDAMTESRVERNLRALGCTLIVITQRLGTAADADRILVLRDGEIVQSGTHRELMREQGEYESLVRAQWREEPWSSASSLPLRWPVRKKDLSEPEWLHANAVPSSNA
jgi:ABC-type bacteriocin/lantibiotic exporter with double-glycine peptidase domain